MAVRAPNQGGILQGSNPSAYDPKNPILVFIIQVSLFPYPPRTPRADPLSS